MIPKSRVLTTQQNPLELLKSEHKDLTSVRPLDLRGEITTWQYDAKNCLRIWFRMLEHGILVKELVHAVQGWAKVLLAYASALAFEESYPAGVCKGTPSILQGYWWLTDALRSIGMWSHDDDGCVVSVSEKVASSMLGALDLEQRHCVLYHRPLCTLGGAVRYRYRLGEDVRVGPYCGKSAVRELTTRIKKALKKHRNPEYRKNLLRKMESKNYGRGSIRAGYRKA